MRIGHAFNKIASRNWRTALSKAYVKKAQKLADWLWDHEMILVNLAWAINRIARVLRHLWLAWQSHRSGGTNLRGSIAQPT